MIPDPSISQWHKGVTKCTSIYPANTDFIIRFFGLYLAWVLLNNIQKCFILTAKPFLFIANFLLKII